MAHGSHDKSILFDGRNWLASSAPGSGLQADQARIFRAIGQDLERKAIATFCLRLAEGRYFVRGLAEMKKAPRRVNSIWAKLTKKSVYTDSLELSYSLEEIERLDAIGRARRGSANQLPDFLSLSQQLRALAAMIDRKGGEIIRLDRIAYEGMIPAVAIHYKTFSGDHAAEEHTASNLYDYCVHMYKTRKPQSTAGSVFRAA
jgi:hypothetical protein